MCVTVFHKAFPHLFIFPNTALNTLQIAKCTVQSFVPCKQELLFCSWNSSCKEIYTRFYHTRLHSSKIRMCQCWISEDSHFALGCTKNRMNLGYVGRRNVSWSLAPTTALFQNNYFQIWSVSCFHNWNQSHFDMSKDKGSLLKDVTNDCSQASERTLKLTVLHEDKWTSPEWFHRLRELAKNNELLLIVKYSS